jgi:hypothetical protein
MAEVIRGARIAAASTACRAEPGLAGGGLADPVLADPVLADAVLPLAGWPCTEPHAARKRIAAAARPMTAGRQKLPDTGLMPEKVHGRHAGNARNAHDGPRQMIQRQMIARRR